MEPEGLIKSNKIFYILMALILFQGVSGIFGGGALILDPSGAILQMPLSILEGSPFETFLVPGIILFLVLGIFPVIIFFGLWRRKRRALTGAMFIGPALLAWIGVEIAKVGYHSEPPLQLVYGLVGLKGIYGLHKTILRISQLILELDMTPVVYFTTVLGGYLARSPKGDDFLLILPTTVI